MTEANEEQREYWNREEALHWVHHQERYDQLLEPYGAAVLGAAEIGQSHDVLDVGCGNGTTTRRAARAASSGSALGVDLSAPMIEHARELAAEESIENVRFEVGDAQTRRFEPEFDRAISRFGVMFFDDPAAAFANIRSGLRADGRVAFVVWQELLANQWVSLLGAVALEFVEMGPPADPHAPGPFALHDPDRVRNLLTQAGFVDLAVDPFETTAVFGDTVDDAATFLTGTRVWLGMFEEASEETRSQARAAVVDALQPHLTPEGVRLAGAAWIVTATSPR